jgi:hypothetical protein
MKINHILNRCNWSLGRLRSSHDAKHETKSPPLRFSSANEEAQQTSSSTFEYIEIYNFRGFLTTECVLGG